MSYILESYTLPIESFTINEIPRSFFLGGTKAPTQKVAQFFQETPLGFIGKLLGFSCWDAYELILGEIAQWMKTRELSRSHL
jgi:hypothetical protein